MLGLGHDTPRAAPAVQRAPSEIGEAAGGTAKGQALVRCGCEVVGDGADEALVAREFEDALAAQGLGRGDRIGILLPQSPETAIAHVAIYKMGAIAVPLFTPFGADALEYRLAHSGARALITDRENLAKIETIRDRLPDLAVIIGIGLSTGRRDSGC